MVFTARPKGPSELFSSLFLPSFAFYMLSCWCGLTLLPNFTAGPKVLAILPAWYPRTWEMLGHLTRDFLPSELTLAAGYGACMSSCYQTSDL